MARRRAARSQPKLITGSLLVYGDNLRVMRESPYFRDESVDLIYLDPPFKHDEKYNVLFRARKTGTPSQAQVRAFDDAWNWEDAAKAAYHDVMENSPLEVRRTIDALKAILGQNNMFAYLCMMTPRLVEMHRILKDTGSIYLHCDPAASHYLKLLMDAVFGAENFRNDIIWKRKAGRGETNKAAIRFGVTADNILFYARSSEAVFNRQHRPSNPEYIKSKFTHTDPDGRIYRLDNITSPSPRPNLVYEYKGHKPPPNGWAVSLERMEEMDREGRLFIPDDARRRIQRKRYLDELEGETVDSLWDDIPPLNSQAKERLG